ncbi:MAG TPA: FecR domain-containing protein [Gemmatimonadaceae bacterium]|jgi:transmembrane sensor|nr:FecR domain-containing protein [Gemmatimonadaceae bacterium]
MSSSDELSPELFERYLAGETTPRETAQVRRLFAEHPDVADALGAYVARLDPSGEPPDTDASWAVLRDRLAAAPRRPPVVRRLPTRPLRWALPIALAAAACLTVATMVTRRPTPTALPRVYTTTVGQRATLTLADGTAITIAPGSRLEVAADFGRERRDVRLDGEAYFAVAHDAARPFTVFAGTVTARDVGTAYVVRHYTDDGAVRVAVREGRVDMSGAGLLRAGDIASRSADGAMRVEHGADTDAMVSWTTGRLAYHDTPLADVRGDLRRWYGIDVAVRRAASDTVRFTGSLAGLPAHDAVALLAATLGLKATWQGSHAVLR